MLWILCMHISLIMWAHSIFIFNVSEWRYRLLTAVLALYLFLFLGHDSKIVFFLLIIFNIVKSALSFMILSPSETLLTFQPMTKSSSKKVETYNKTRKNQHSYPTDNDLLI